MSKMSDLSIEIEELLFEGLAPNEISNSLNIPLEWVEGVQELLESQEYEIFIS